jgi:hypothetical protein
MSSQSFHRIPGGRVQKITAEVQFEPQKLESFDPMTQESYRLSPAMIHTNTNNSKSKIGGNHKTEKTRQTTALDRDVDEQEDECL